MMKTTEARMTELMRTQTLGLEGVTNARELGGYEVADGRVVRRSSLLRSGTPTTATEADRARLRDHYHLTRVLDFRMSFERESPSLSRGTAPAPTGDAADGAEPRPLEFATTITIPILNEQKMLAQQEGAADLMRQGLNPLDLLVQAIESGLVGPRMYVDFLEDDWGKRGYARMFEELLALPANEALLFHCTQGKDRTGLAAWLILATLGADDETATTDYLLTNAFNARIIEREEEELLAAGIAREDLDTYMVAQDKVFPEILEAARTHLTRTYGSVWGYVREALGLDEGARQELRAKFLVEG